MIQLLHAEASLVCLNIQLLSESNALMIQHASRSKLRSRLAKYFGTKTHRDYVNGF